MPKQSNDHNDLEVAKRVLQQEQEGLHALEDWLGEDFAAAVELIANSDGRVILSGMGKSGHIAHKIAATMASTGTPAQFVHPGEASHGDLGMVTKNDVLVLLSNSGETKELHDIIDYSRRFSIPLIGIVRRDSSILVSASDVALVLPEIPEASSVDAPTTSTTMMLALGDALAVALLERKGFGIEDFNVFHPGGKLGTRLLKVSDIMHKDADVPMVGNEAQMADVLLEMTGKRLGCAGVVDDANKLLGIVTDGDLRRHMSDDFTKLPVADVMTAEPVTIHSEALASEALQIMEQRAITNIFVVDDGIVVGVVHIHDILKAGVA